MAPISSPNLLLEGEDIPATRNVYFGCQIRTSAPSHPKGDRFTEVIGLPLPEHPLHPEMPVGLCMLLYIIELVNENVCDRDKRPTGLLWEEQ